MLGCATAEIVLTAAYFLFEIPAIALIIVCFAATAAVFILKGIKNALIFPLILILITAVSLYKTEQRAECTEYATRISVESRLLIIGEPETENGKTVMKARIIEHPMLLRGTGVRLAVSDEAAGSAAMGDTVSAVISISASAAQLSLRDKANGIFAEVKCLSAPRVYGNRLFLSLAGQVRGYVRQTIQCSVPEGESAVLCALIIGDKNAVTDEFSNSVRCAGLSHVLVVSGMHLATVMNGLSALLRRMGAGRIVKATVSLLGLLLFSAVCGFTMSVIRAGVTYALSVGAVLLNRDGEPINLLAGAVSVITAFSPYALFSISFQLSVMSTLGILVIMPPISKTVCLYIPMHGIVKGLEDAFIGSLAAMIMTMPITVWYFGGFSLAAPATNILISYPVTWALLATASALLLSPVPFIAKPLLLAAGVFARWFREVAELFGTESVMLPVGKWGSAVSAAFICVISVMLYLSRERRRISELKRVMKNESYNGGRA